MKEGIINFKTAKLAKEKGFDEDCQHFYTKPNSKMFGIDEHNRAHPIKNIAKKLYVCGNEAALNIESVYFAPTQSLLQKWLREVHKIHITVTSVSQESWQYHITNIGDFLGKLYEEDFYTYEEALKEGLFKALKLVK